MKHLNVSQDLALRKALHLFGKSNRSIKFMVFTMWKQQKMFELGQSFALDASDGDFEVMQLPLEDDITDISYPPFYGLWLRIFLL